MTFLLIITRWLLVTVIVAEGSRERYFTFSSDILEPHAYTVLEGETVHLICHQDYTDEVQVLGKNINYVTEGELVQEWQDNAEFTRNGTTGVLSFIPVTRNNGDTFICRKPKAKYLDLEIIYSPSQEYPRCNSNYERHVFFDDKLQEPFQFNCSTEKADPDVDMILYIDKAGRKRQIVTSDLNVHEHQLSEKLSFTPYLDSSFDNSSLICRVTQQLPAPYQNYQESCSFGPLVILPTFSVSIHPPHYNVITRKGDNITLTCKSNVSEVVLEWTNIPIGDPQYNVTSINGSLQLELFNYKPGGNISTCICNGSYEGRVISENITIGERLPEGDSEVNVTLIVILIILLVCSAIIIISIVYYLKYIKGNADPDRCINWNSMNRQNRQTERQTDRETDRQGNVNDAFQDN